MKPNKQQAKLLERWKACPHKEGLKYRSTAHVLVLTDARAKNIQGALRFCTLCRAGEIAIAAK